jgi:hypothetical protein
MVTSSQISVCSLKNINKIICIGLLLKQRRYIESIFFLVNKKAAAGSRKSIVMPNSINFNKYSINLLIRQEINDSILKKTLIRI